MRILFDHNAPYRLAAHLRDHSVTSAVDCGWERLTNGDLLAVAELAGFELLLTADKNLRYQQNLSIRKIAIVVRGNSPWHLVKLHIDAILTAVNAATLGSYTEVEIPLPPKKSFERP